ncbi:hypothetical protein EIL87_25755 [Saccharopolyspora rhizosphaerae]|uniref:Uncharacterized protein n=1 Tax=Saccharopolyspora rhizosphaerae TaxID=2492662 RepID=A0A3R8PYD5_9PSEU|nr:hypothetical protein [Saccharopolyspora rhizosphaerae]RRO13057.1 hypothetical protein EIL87_25755 [Saccharopolyspora rhizosphaerae]
MIYALAAIGAITIAVLMWKAFGPEVAATARPRRTPVAPDDDPEFLRKLAEQQRNNERPAEED